MVRVVPRQEHDGLLTYGERIADVALATRTWKRVVEEDLGTEVDVFDPRS